MNHPLFGVRFGVVIVGVLLSNSSFAQNLLVVENSGKPAVVRAARGTRPLIIENDKPKIADGSRYALHPVETIYPLFVSVRNFRVRTTGVHLNGSGNSINNQLELTGEFISQTNLKDVFLALELTMEDGEKSILLQEIGELSSRHPRWINLVFRTGYNLGKGHFQFHLFTEGMEVLNSMQRFDYRERLLDKFIAKQVKDRPDGPPQPFVCPAPEYPAALAKKKINGRAVVKIRIRSTGAVLDPALVEASAPAFGEAAIEAVRAWRFIPAIKNGRAVEITANMPLDFNPAETVVAAEKGK